MSASVSEKIICFIQHRMAEIHKGGLPVLIWMVGMLLAMAPAALVVLLVRALRPLVVIRFGQLRSRRIGHFAGDTELYLCRRDAGIDSRRTFDVFYHQSSACNHQLKKMWDRTLHISRFAHPVDWFNRHLPGGEKHMIPMPTGMDILHGHLARHLANTPAHLSFTPEEVRLGRRGIQELGISNGAPFVCIYSRDSAYLSAVLPGRNWYYHDHRNSNIENFIPAAEELVRRGYFVVRMGAVVKEPLQTTNSMIIDYATKGRAELLDIFLGAKCHFYLGDSSGIHIIPLLFKRPLAFVNIIPLEYAPMGPNYLFIPKKLWLRKERRFLTFREILNSEVRGFVRTEQYDQLGVEVIENTPEEITAVAVEMDERLKGTWQTTEEDEELQRRLWSIFKPSELNKVFRSRIGAEFLRQNRELLD